MFVLVDDMFREGNACFRRHLAVIENAGPGAVRTVGPAGRAVFVNYLSLGQAIKPGRGGDVRIMFLQKIPERGPRPGGKPLAAGGNSGIYRKRCFQALWP